MQPAAAWPADPPAPQRTLPPRRPPRCPLGQAAGGSFNPLTALLSQYMLKRDARYYQAFAAIAADYAANHKHKVLASACRGGLGYDDTHFKAKGAASKPYARDAGWTLRLAGDVLPQLVLVLAGFFKVQDDAAQGVARGVGVGRLHGAPCLRSRPPMSSPRAIMRRYGVDGPRVLATLWAPPRHHRAKQAAGQWAQMRLDTM